MTSTGSRLLPSEEAAELLELTREIADRALAPRAAEDEARKSHLDTAVPRHARTLPQCLPNVSLRTDFRITAPKVL